MIVKVGSNGEVSLEKIFTKAVLNKIHSYSMSINDKAISVKFFDITGKQVIPKLRKRGQAKKA